MKSSCLLLLALTPALVSLVGCDRSDASSAGRPPATQPAAVAVQVGASRVADLPRRVSLTGTLFGDDSATISAKVAGRVVKLSADVGDRVAAGAELARVDAVDAELAVQQRELALREALARVGLGELPPPSFDPSSVATVQRARFQAQNALARLERARRLFEQTPPLISEQEYADLQTAYEVALRDQEVELLLAQSQLAAASTRSAELAAARQRLADTVIRAPGEVGDPTTAAALPRFAVSARLTSLGEYVREGDPIYELVADDPIKFRGSAPERFVGQIAPGQPVTLQVEGVGEVRGQVSRVNPTIDLESRTFEIEAIVPNADQRLRPGGFARADVIVGARENVALVPESSLVTFAGLSRVFLADGGKAKAFAVTMRERPEPGWIAIDEPLPPGSTVITAGGVRLSDGVPIEIAPTTQPPR